MQLGIYLLTVVLLACSTSASNEENHDIPSRPGNVAPDFTLKDADDQVHSLKKLRGKVIFLIMGNRKIRKEDDKWASAFQKDYEGNDRIRAYIIADMRSVPGFVPKGFIKKQLKKNKPPVTLLLDWKGEAHKAYRTRKEKPNLYVANPEGKIAFHMKANFDKKIYQQLKAAIENEMEEVRKREEIK